MTGPANIRRSDETNQYRLLTRHFCGRFFDRETLAAPQVELSVLMVQILALLVLPGALQSLYLYPKYGAYIYLSIPARDLATLPDKFFFLSLSMILLGFLTIFVWEALFPDRRDCVVLAPLPVRARTVFSGKATALILFLLTFTVAINACPAVLFPLGVLARRAAPIQIIRYVFSHSISVLLGNVFVFLSAISLQGALLTILPRGAAQAVSRWVRFSLLLLLLCALFSFPAVQEVDRLLHNGDRFWALCPPMWFLGIYEVLLGSRDPVLLHLAGRAISALAFTGVLSLLTYAACYRRFMQGSLEQSTSASQTWAALRTAWNSLLDRCVLRNPRERASFHFAAQTMFRSPRHTLYLACFAGFALSLALLGLITAAYSNTLSGARYLYQVLIAIPLVLSFFVLVGTRIGYAVPVDLDANWLFRLAPIKEVQTSISGVRKFMICLAIIPVFVFLALFYALFWDWRAILVHFCFALTLSIIFMEFLLAGFAKIPFTFSYRPAAGSILGFLMAMGIGGRFLGSMEGLESWLLGDVRGFVYFYAIACVVLIALRRHNARPLRTGVAALQFEQESDDDLTLLQLDLPAMQVPKP